MEKEQSINDNIIMVASSSSVKNVAGCVIKFIEKSEYGEVEMRAVGASALNQLIKAVTIARSILASQGYDLLLRTGFVETRINDETRTSMRVIAFIGNPYRKNLSGVVSNEQSSL